MGASYGENHAGSRRYSARGLPGRSPLASSTRVTGAARTATGRKRPAGRVGASAGSEGDHTALAFKRSTEFHFYRSTCRSAARRGRLWFDHRERPAALLRGSGRRPAASGRVDGAGRAGRRGAARDPRRRRGRRRDDAHARARRGARASDSFAPRESEPLAAQPTCRPGREHDRRAGRGRLRSGTAAAELLHDLLLRGLRQGGARGGRRRGAARSRATCACRRRSSARCPTACGRRSRPSPPPAACTPPASSTPTAS